MPGCSVRDNIKTPDPVIEQLLKLCHVCGIFRLNRNDTCPAERIDDPPGNLLVQTPAKSYPHRDQCPLAHACLRRQRPSWDRGPCHRVACKGGAGKPFSFRRSEATEKQNAHSGADTTLSTSSLKGTAPHEAVAAKKQYRPSSGLIIERPGATPQY